MDNKTRSEGRCLKCARYQKQISRLKNAFIESDDDHVRICMHYEAMIKRLKAEHSSGSQREKVLARVGGPDSNTTLHALSSVKGEANEH